MNNIKDKLVKAVITAICICAPLQLLGYTEPPVPLSDDNGHRAFVKQLLPKLLGRKPRGMLEVNLLADIAELHGREALVRTLMESPQFSEHWTALLVDHLKVRRDDLPASCFNEGMFTPGLSFGGKSVPIAEFILNNDFSSNYPGEFNLFDVIESSISIDNLMPIFRSYLFVLSAHPRPNDDEAIVRKRLGDEFNAVYLNRNKDCIGCHNTTYSTTGIGDRTHPLYRNLDIALFDPDGGLTPETINNNDYIDNCSSCHQTDGKGNDTYPGILGASAVDIQFAINQYAAMQFLSSLSSETIVNIESALAIGPFSGSNLVETNAKNEALFRTDFFELETPELGWGPWGMTTDCASISGVVTQGAIDGFFAGAHGNYASVQEMDSQFASGFEQLKNQFDVLPSLDYNDVLDGNLAYAYRTAATITENVWEQLMGERLSIVNQYPRNAYQRNLLAYLTEEQFVANDWSLKELILSITTSRFFNRRAPLNSLANDPYELQALFDPFVDEEACLVNYDEDEDRPIGPNDTITAGSRITHSNPRGVAPNSSRKRLPVKITSNEPCQYNGQGDIVHRFSPRTLLNSVAAALAWPKPKIKPNNSYPKQSFTLAIGQQWSDEEPGNKEVNFQALLHWDDAYGACSAKQNDWISRLIPAIDIYNAENTSQLTLQDVVITMKDWLIQEPGFGGMQPPSQQGGKYIASNTVQKSEYALVKDFFGQNLNSPVDSSISEEKLRELCGVYLKTPQFMMAGIVRNDAYTVPKLRVCNTPDCSYKQMCQNLSGRLDSLGFATRCNNNSVTKPFGITTKFSR